MDVDNYDDLVSNLSKNDVVITITKDIAINESHLLPAITSNKVIITSNGNRIYRTEANTSKTTGMFTIG